MKRNTASPGLTAVTYARVSSKEQEKEGYSIPAQQKLLNAYAAEKGIAILQEFVDVETAKQSGRAAFGELVEFLKKTKSCRAVLVEKTDRLYRNFKDYVLLDDLDVELHFVKEGTVLSKDSRSGEKFVHGIKVLMAKNYIDNLSEETRKGMAEKAAQGAYPTRCPLGYRNVTGADGRKTIEPDPDYAPLVRKLFEWYATGTVSLNELVSQAHAAGFVYKNSKKPVARAAIHKLLTNRMFTGKFLWKGKLHQGTYTPLITEDLWEKVQAILRKRNQTKTRKGTRTFAFTRLITCGHCGCALVGEEKKRKYVYYHCTGFKGKCPEPFVREEVLEAKFTAVLRRIAFDDDVIALVAAALRESHKDQKRFHEEAIARLQAEQTKLQNRIDGAYEDKLDGTITAEFFERKTADWRAEQERLHRLIAQHQQANRSYLEEGVKLLELARRAADLFAAQPAGEKRRLLDFVLSNCTWAKGELAVEFRQPFDLLAVAADAINEKKAIGRSPDDLRPEKLPARDTERTRTRPLAGRVNRSYFTRCARRRHVFQTGRKPETFRGARPSQRAWQSFVGRQKRENPVRVADRFLAQARLPSCRTYAQVAEHFGVSTAKVSYYLALLTRLPEEFVGWLRGCDDPIVLGYLTERRLRPVTRVQDRQVQQDLIEQLKKEARAFTATAAESEAAT